MEDALITILIVNYNSSDFVLNNLYSLQKLTKNGYRVIIRDNNSKIKDYKKLKKNTQKISNIELYRVENFKYKGSMAHGLALNDLFKKVETKYGLILDPDCIFLQKYWDEILIKQLNDEYPIIGTQAPWYKFQDFPYVFALFFVSDIMKKLKIDFRPDDIFEKDQDTGYQVRKIFLENGYKGKLLINKYTLDFKTGPFKDILCQEFYLNNNKTIFASHFWKGSTLGDWKYRQKPMKWIRKIPLIGKYLIRYVLTPDILNKIGRFKGRSEKNTWIRICRKIIESSE